MSNDATARSTHNMYVATRDELGASYRAGLRAGGDDVDWVGWYRDHIGRWPGRQDAPGHRGAPRHCRLPAANRDPAR